MNRASKTIGGNGSKPSKIASATALSFLLVLGQMMPLLGNPSGGVVVAGAATIGSAGATLSINQSTGRAIINWQQFSIAGGETTKFIVPNSGATLNRVVGGNLSAIYGTLQSNGALYLINPSGILVGPSGRINTSSFLASTLDVSNQQFLAGGDLTLAGGSNGTIDNEGIIHATGGDVYLIANQVTNNGTIKAPHGTVGLAAGSEVLYQQAGSQHLFIQSTPAGTKRALGVTNAGTIQAAAAELKAAGGNAYALAINNTGVIAATGYKKINGQVYLTSDGGSISNSGKISARNGCNGGTIVVDGTATSSAKSGTVTNSGTLDASATAAGGSGGTVTVKNMGGTTVHSGTILAKGGQGGTGGNAEVSGQVVDYSGTVNLSAPGGTTGSLLFDPENVIIQASGPSTTTASGSPTDTFTGGVDSSILTVSDLEAALANASVTVTTGGAGSTGSQAGDITVATTGTLTWSADTDLTLSAYRNITVSADVTNTNVAGNKIVLQADNSGTGIGTVNFTGGAQISTPGKVSIFYNPSDNPQGSAINSTSYTAPTDYSGDVAGGATLSAHMLVNTLNDLQNVENNLSGTFALGNNIDATPTVSWNGGAGFVPIGNTAGVFNGTFNGQDYTINGLYINLPSTTNVGLFGYTGSLATIKKVGLTNVQITGYQAGGLVGTNSGTISNAYTTGTLTGNSNVGGLVGLNDGGAISTSYSTAAVSGVNNLGGLVGYNDNSGTISNVYSLGAVTGTGVNVGGLAGVNDTATISNAYSTGAVNGSGSVGGLVGGANGGTISNSFWDTTTSGQGGSQGGTGDSTTTLLAESTYSSAGWSIGTDPTSDTWVIFDGQTRPMLAMEYSTTISNAHQLQLIGLNSTTLAANYTVASNIDLSGTTNASDVWGTSTTNGGAGFVPIGTDPGSGNGIRYSGTFNGQGFTLNAPYLDTPSANYVGLFGELTGTVTNVKLTNADVTGLTYVGSLVGVNEGTVSNSSSTGTVSGTSNVGGLVGYNNNSAAISNSFSAATVSGSSIVGGLTSVNDGPIVDSYSTGAVSGTSILGGLVAWNDNGSINSSYSTATVTGSTSGSYVGGLVGYNNNGSIENAYSTGTVSSGSSSFYVGGLVGLNNGPIGNTYSTGVLNGGSGSTDVGGLVGINSAGTTVNSFWDTDTSGQSVGVGGGSSSGVTGATTAQLESQTFILANAPTSPTWDFTNVWTTAGGTLTPQLIGLPESALPGDDLLSGTAFTNSGVTATASGTTIDLIFNGSLLGSPTTTNSSGGFSFSVPAADLTSGILFTDATDNGDTYYQITSPQSIITGIDLWGNTMRVVADSASNTALGTAAGSLNASTYGINYSVNAAALATNTGVNMSILDNFTQDGIVSAYTLDGNITAGGALTTSANSALTASSSVQLTGSSVTLAGSVSSGGTLSVDSTSGNITIDNGTVTAQNASFTAASALNITEPSEEIALGGAVTTPGGSGGYVDITNGTTITAQSATFSADGPLFIVGTSITLNGGDLTASGNGYTNATDTDKTDGIDIYNSTINAQGGSITLTGNAGYSNVSGVDSAGFGVQIGNASTIETSGSGNITIAATLNQNINSQSGLDAFSIYGTGNSISGGSGLISITGNVLQGKADGTAEYGANVSGIEIGGGASVTANSAGGSISLTGDVSGADSVVSGANFSFSSGIEIGGATGAGTALSVVGPNAGAGGTLTLNGTGSSLDATDYTGTGNNNPFSIGTTIDSGAQVSAGANSTISITGTENPGTTGANIGMVGAMINGGAQVQITGTGGTINITGNTSGTNVVSIGGNNSFNEGVEIDANNTLAPVVSVAGSGSITITGTAGTVNTSSSTLTNNSINNLPGSLGAVITSDAEIVTGTNSTLNIMGTGGAVTTTSAFTGDSQGVYLDDATEISMDTGATLSITGFGGAVNAGNGANANDAGTRGVDIEGNIAVATGGGITITGTGGSIDISNASAITGSQFPGTEGVYMGGNSDLAASGTTTLTLMGTGGTVTAGSNLIGDSIGVDIGNNQPNTGNNQAKSNLISAGSGLIKITGVAGTTPSLGIGVDIFGLGLGSTSIESTGGNIAITGTGGSGYTGTGTVVGNYIPNDGVAVADNSTLTTGGTGTISFTGTGGSNSSGVEFIELTSDTTLDADPTAPAITSGAALSINSLAGSNISITDANVFAPNATITAAGKLSISDQQIALGGVGSYGVGVQIKNGTTITATSANVASTGNLTIQDSSITLNGGNFTGTGTGYISSTDSAGIVYGINVIGSTINAQGGNISLTGVGGYFLGSGELIEAGDGINIYDDSNNTTIETNGTGNISLLGSFNHNITTYSGLAGVSVGDGSSGTITISVAQGALSINGTVSQGTFGDGTTAQPNGQGGIEGVNIVGAVIEATGTGGSVSITGNTTGTKAFDNATGGSSQNEGISINYSNSPTSTISVGTNGTLTLSGTAGTVDSTYATNFSNTGRSVGLDISTGTQITGGTGATLSLTGTGGSAVTNDAGSAATDTSYTGQAEGFFIGDSDSLSSISQVSVGGGGSIHITGTGGSIDVSNDATPPNHEDPDANGVQVTNGTQITAAGTSTITIQGTGGTVNAGSNTFGGAGGVNISGGSSTGLNTLITSASGQITIIGIGGTAPNKGLGVLIAGTNGVTSTIESTSGNISITGTGGNGYNADDIIVSNYVPNYGILVADAATLMTGGSGTISLTGTGGSISTGVEIVELTNDSTIDTAPVLPTITAGGAFNADALSGTGINVNGTITADGVTLGTGTSGNFASITSGNLLINSATITLTGGNFTAFGKGNFPYGSDVDGVDIFSSTINAAGGTINVTGQGTTFVYDESGGVAALDGLNIAGEGSLIDVSTLETTGTSGITVYGDASVGSTTVQNELIGLEDDNSNLSVVNGVITLTGTVNSGTALSTSVASSAGLGDNGIVGTFISVDVASNVSSISASGANGAIAIIGNVSGSTSDGSDFSSDNHDSGGVEIKGTGLSISSAGNGVAFVNSGTTYNGIYIQGTGGHIINNQIGSGGDSGADGVSVTNGALVAGTGAAQISLVGQGGSNTTSPSGTVTGSAAGIVMDSKASSSAPNNGNTQITTATGSISLMGTAGTSPDKGVGIAIVGEAGGVTTVSSTSGTITLKGLGGTGNTAGLTTFGSPGTQTDLPNDGVAIFGDAILQTGGTGGISVTGAGQGAEGAAILVAQGVETTGPSLIASSGPLSLTTLSSGVGDIVLDDDTLPSTSSYNGTSVTFSTQGNGAVVLTNTNIQLNDAPITINGTSVSANTSVVQSSYTTGVEIVGSTIDTGGGSISLTGLASYAYDASVTGNLAGEGIFIGGSTVETASSLQSSITSGNITVNGNGSIGANTVVNVITGVEINTSTLSLANGNLTVTGDANSGTADNGNNPNALSNNHDGPTGVYIQDGSVVEATGTGSIAITGDVSSSTSNLSGIVSGGGGDSIGVHVDGYGSGNTISVAGGTGGITITGYGGATINGGASSGGLSEGIDLYNGTQVTAGGAAPITLTGTGSTNTPTSGQVVGGSFGVGVSARTGDSFDPESTVEITSVSGAIHITGTGGATPINGQGINVLGENGGTVTIESTSGAITFTGTGGSGNTGQASTSTSSLGAIEPNDGITVLDGVTVQTNALVTFTGAGAGTGADGVVIDQYTNGSITTGSDPLIGAGTNTLNIVSTSGDIVYGGTGTAGSPVVGAAVLIGSAGNVAINTPVSSSNGVVQVSGNVIDLNAAVNSTNGNILFVDHTQFVNTAGSNALSATNGFDWQVWSVNPTGSGQSTVDTDDSLTPNYIQYGATYGITTPLGTGNGLLYSYAPAALAVTLDGTFTKTYNATQALTIGAGSYTLSSSGLLTGDSLNVATASSLNGTLNSKDVATANMVTVVPSQISYDVTQAGIPVYGYTISSVSAPATVTAATLTASLTGAVDKVYDSTTTATLAGSNYNLTGTIYGGDTVALNDPTTGTYDTKDAGTGKTVTVSGLALTGAQEGDYTLTGTTVNAAIGTITPATLTANLTGTVAKSYDGTTTATLAASNYNLTGTVYSGDTVALNDPTSGTYDTATAGTGKTVTVSGLALLGASNADYTLAATTISGAVGTITQAGIVIASLTGNVTKVYDGTTIATLTNANYILAGVMNGDNVVLNDPTTGTFDTKDAGTNKTITVTGLSLSGAQAVDYTLSSTTISAAIGTITQAVLTASLIGTVSKVYDATTAATLNGANYNLAGVLPGDVVGLNDPTTGIYDTKDVGTGKMVTVSGLALTGAQAGDYALTGTTVNAAIGTISQATLTAMLTGSVTKVYDSTTVATLNGSDYNLGGVLGNDTVVLNDPTSGTYDTKDADTNKIVTVTGLALSGAQAADYTLGTATASGAIGTITPATLTPSLTGTVSKVYDGTTVSALNPANVSLATVFNGDSVGVSGTVSYGQTKDVSSNDAVAISGLTLTGPSAGDYQLSTSNLSGNTGAITPATLTYVATPVTIDYGATIPALSGMVTGFAAGDTLSSVTSGTLSFTTQATAMSDAGSYAITGMGLIPTNNDYLFAQAGANAMALTILAPPTTVTTTTISTTTGGADNGQSNIVPPAITPQTTVITTPPAVVAQTTTTPPPVNMTGQVGTINQPVVTTTTFADSSGNSGQVGSGDVAQLNNGELNNVANPHATSALNEALGPVVYHTLSDALQAAGDFTDADTTGATDNTAAAGAGDGETILTGGEVAEVGDDGAKKIPLSQAPAQLRNALAGDVLQGVASGH